MKPTWNQHETNMKPTWNQHELNMKPTRNQHEINMKPTWIQHKTNMKPTWNQHEPNMTPTWSQHEPNMEPTWHPPLKPRSSSGLAKFKAQEWWCYRYAHAKGMAMLPLLLIYLPSNNHQGWLLDGCWAVVGGWIRRCWGVINGCWGMNKGLLGGDYLALRQPMLAI